MRLHLIRHSRPLVGAGICYGQLDLACENPIPIADALRDRLSPEWPVWTSPLTRCVQLADALTSTARRDQRLMEMHFGDWEGRPWDDIDPQELSAWAADVNGYAPPGGESPDQVRGRVEAFLSEHRAPNLVLVTHAGVIRLLQASLAGCSVVDVPSPAYGTLTVLDLI